MLFRFTKLWVAIGLLIAMWGFGTVRRSDPRVWVRPIGSRPLPVRITQFYASVGSLTKGQKALLCYGVENAKSVKISPTLQGVYPALSRCMEILPEHTTHYMIMAEGFDGQVATRSFTLAVQAVPVSPQILNYATVSTRPITVFADR
ncbi:MAG TPA: hypothetical protein VGH38_36295 [Bryobacteraceae bacterium]|jgi:hypothetical protein